jgi:hypothetical protein
LTEAFPPATCQRIANSDAINTRSEVDRRVFERASAVIVNDWESVTENK